MCVGGIQRDKQKLSYLGLDMDCFQRNKFGPIDSGDLEMGSL